MRHLGPKPGTGRPRFTFSRLEAFARSENTARGDRAILRAFGKIAIFVLLAKLIAAAKEIVVANVYGVSAVVDAYLFVFNLVIYSVSIWLSILTIVLLPLATRARRVAPQDLPRFQSELLALTIFSGITLLFLYWQGLPWILKASWSGLSPTTRDFALAMAPVLAWIAPLGLLAALYSTWTMSVGRHINTFLEGMPALGILVFVLAMSGDWEALAWGTVAGMLVQVLCLLVITARRKELSLPVFRMNAAHWSPLGRGIGIMILAQMIVSLGDVVDQFFAVHVGSGAVSTLSYANRIVALVLGVGATAVTRSTLPTFSDTGHADSSRQLARRWAWLLFATGIGALVVGYVAAPWAVALLYERGAFSSKDTHSVALVLQVGLTQVPFYLMTMVQVAYLASRGLHSRIATIAVANFSVKLLANFLFLPLFGLYGIVLATTVMYATSCLLMGLAISRDAGEPAT
jgi:putative peptidoglycan lipid II flippase